MLFSLLAVLLLGSLSSVASQPIIERVSGCTDFGSSTVDCVLPVTLTVYGHGFLTGFNGDPNAQDKLDFVINHPSINGKSVACLTATAINLTFTDTVVECQIPVYGLMTLDTDNMLSLYSNNEETGQVSNTFTGIKIKKVLPPVIHAVSGCSIPTNEPLSARGCRIGTDLITLTGTNFMSIYKNMVIMKIGPLNIQLLIRTSMYGDGTIVSINDSQMVISLLPNWPSLQIVEAFDGHALTFSFSDAFYNNWKTNAVTLQFAEIPLPELTSVTTAGARSCEIDQTNKIARYCEPGEFMPLRITGQNLFGNISLSIAGQPLYLYSSTSTTERVFELPAYEFPVNEPLPLIITSVAGTVTTDFMFIFDGNTVVNGLISCILPAHDGSKYMMKCVEGETVGLHLLYASRSAIDVATAQFQWRSKNESLVVPLPCSYAGQGGRFECKVPPRPAFNTTGIPFQSDDWGYLELVNSDRLIRSNHTLLWDLPDVPRIHSVSGCYSTTGSNTDLNQCLGEELITLTGVRFPDPGYRSGQGQVYINSNPGVCRMLTVSADRTSATCELPTVEQAVEVMSYNTPLRVFWQRVGPDSNFVTITMVTQITPPPSASSVSSTTIVLAVVFSIVGALLFICLGVYVRKQRCEKQPNFLPNHSDSADVVATEMI